jgi:uncharacterized cupredoxin-like copper-binding protein
MNRTNDSVRRARIVLLLLMAACFASCGDSDDAGTSAGATKLTITADDYGFAAPESIRGGTVEINFTNNGKEPHFAGLAKVAPGKTVDDVRAALVAPPSAAPTGPPPFEDYAGMPTTDPGRSAQLTLNLPAGTYALFCVLPSPDGLTHAHKGMVKQRTVTEGDRVALPKSAGTVVATDFGLAQVPHLEAGSNVVALRNDGKQLHEVNLVELAPGKTVDDVVRWYRQPAGPPPMTSLGGVAVKPGEEGVARMELKRGSTYAFVCAIPDVLGDFAPHITKGMFTSSFTVA